jgi:hypothetical protein
VRQLARRAGLALTLALVLAGFVPQSASADTVVQYYSGTLTENYHNFGRCYYTIASECSGFNYWQWNQANISSANGAVLIAFDRGGEIRGTFGYAGWNVRYWDHDALWDGMYIRGSVTLWGTSTAGFYYARVCGGSYAYCYYYPY